MDNSIFSKIELRMDHSLAKHGNWDDYTLKQMWEKIEDERQEVLDAEALQEYTGEHGVASELLDMAVTCLKMHNQVIKRIKSGALINKA